MDRISTCKGHNRQPSFSSSLLDQIYHSIDVDSSPVVESTINHHHRRSIAADFDRSKRKTTVESVFLGYSNSITSSDSSGFSSSSSSSESHSFYNHHQQPKPIRTSVERFEISSQPHRSVVVGVHKPNNVKQSDLGGFLRTKSKALKIYADFKKSKQPISPGGRLATFLNSLFTNSSNNNRKNPKKITTVAKTAEPRSAKSTITICSSSSAAASSFSRSCLSKTPSSSSNSVKSKRSVRFCPVNVIIDENSSIQNNHRHVIEEEENRRRVIEAAKDLIRTYQKKKKNENNNHLAVVKTYEEEEEEDDDDLFELENLSAIGIDRYREELPVYETTRLDYTNRPIATIIV